jgi:hypothetical protein
MQVSVKSESMMRMMCMGVVTALASRYGFDANEALECLPIERERKEKKEKKEKEVDFPFPLKCINESMCKSVRMNRGLYTQCKNSAVKNDLCKGCGKEEEKHGSLTYGRIEERMKAGNDYRDSKGRKPIAYGVVLKRLNITREEAEAKGLEVGIVLSDSDFEIPEKVSGSKKKMGGGSGDENKRGRPKKNIKIIESESENEDLFAGLVQQSLNESVDSDSSDESESVNTEKSVKKEAKALEKAAKEEAKALEKAEKKKALEEAKALEKAEKKKALEEAKALEKAEKKKALEDAKALEKAAKKDAKALEKAAKEEKPAKKETNKKKVESLASLINGEEEEEEEEEEKEVSVKKFEFGGKVYLKTESNVLYDSETQEEIGVWNEAKQEIEFSELEEEEEEE